jgi:(E)-4-hydroxy-3-methylbut-2-enyl-diphosphate synthase
MVHAYRLLVEAMEQEGMTYPIHLGVTEAGNGIEGRIKSAVGIGALLSDGIGDTIRVSLTEAPENEVPVARMITDHFAVREGEFSATHPERYHPTEFVRRSDITTPVTHDEIDNRFLVLESHTTNPTAELRAAILSLENEKQPVAVKCRYEQADIEEVAVKAAAGDINRVLEETGTDASQVDHYLQHQANIRIINAIQHYLEQPQEKFPTNIADHGNSSSACCPILLDECNRSGRFKRGDIIAMSAFGAGFVSGAVLLEW